MRNSSHIVILTVVLVLVMSTGAYYNSRNIEYSVEEINIKIVYDPYTDYGVVTYQVVFSQIVEYTAVNVALIGDGIVEIINVTGSDGQVFPYTYIDENTSITALINNTDTLTIVYEISGFMDEIGLGTYSGLLDLSLFSGINMSLEIILTDTFKVSTDPGRSYVEYDDGVTIIKITSPEIYIIYIEKAILTGTPARTDTPIETETTTTTTVQSTTTTSITDTTHTLTQEQTIITTTTTATATAPPSGETAVLPLYMIILIIMIVAALIIVAILLKR